MDNIRVSELAKEMNITSKELIEKFAEISIAIRSHSNIVTSEQARRIKEYMGIAPKKNPAKKAFIVKKAKTVEEPVVEKLNKNEIQKAPKIERVKKQESQIEIVKRKAEVQDLKVEEPVVQEVKKAEKPAIRIERTKIEYPKNQSRIEIVRRAPQRLVAGDDRKKDNKNGDKVERKPFNKQSGDKKLVERRIIPQEIYEGKGLSKKKSEHKKADPSKGLLFVL